jgi:N-methylhydantoinase A/oxoprolinase/acetone carboxylase beta subunit
MAVLLGVDTGGTYTDAVILDAGATTVLGKAKSLTTRADLSLGIGRAVDAALAGASVAAGEVAMVSLSTTLATNALVEGQGGRIALVFLGFDEGDARRAGLAEALQGDPLIAMPGGHTHAGTEAAVLDLSLLEQRITQVGPGVMGYAVASRFATRNPAHELAARDLIRRLTGRPVTCSHELSANLNGPKRALTAVLNARLIGMIDRLVTACETHLSRAGIAAPLMVVRGDGALISASMVRERPIETILSGPAASIVGARWLTGTADALVSDIGGTTTDVALLRGGLPDIDPDGARVGAFRTMVEAVAMRTTGLGGDSEVHMVQGLDGGLRLGPRRLVPVSLLAVDHGPMVHAALDRALTAFAPGEHDGRFAIPMATGEGLPPREAALLARLTAPMPVAGLLQSRLEGAALDRLVARGLVMLSGVTPTDASHVLGRLADWDGTASAKALELLTRRRNARGDRIAPDAATLAQRIVDQLTAQTVDCLLEAAVAEDPLLGGAGIAPAALAAHPLLRAGLSRHQGIVQISARLGVPVIGLGASAPSYYGAVGERLGCPMILPDHAGVANAIGAVVGQVVQKVTGLVTSPAEGRFAAHLPEGVTVFSDLDQALATMEATLAAAARARALHAGAAEAVVTVTRDIGEAEVEGRRMFVEARLTATASGRPRVAHPATPAQPAPAPLGA